MIEQVDPHEMTRKQVIMFLGIHSETFDSWCNDPSMPRLKIDGKVKDMYRVSDIFKWRLEKEKKKGKEADGDPESVLKQKIGQQELRKKTRENDEADGLLVDKKKMERLYFDLGKNIRQNIMSKPQVYAPECAGKSSFEIMTYLMKEFERLCNGIAGLEGINFKNDIDEAYEYHEMFMKGYDYAKSQN